MNFYNYLEATRVIFLRGKTAVIYQSGETAAKIIKRKHDQEVQASLIGLEKTIKTSDDRDEVLKAFEGYKQLTTKKRKT